MTYRLGKVKRIVEVRLPRPRNPANTEFNRLEAANALFVAANGASTYLVAGVEQLAPRPRVLSILLSRDW